MSTLKATTLSNLAGSKTVPTDTVVDGSAKAWVNFNGTGTVAIRRSFNVSSITDVGTGNYVVNFASAMPDANYSALVTSSLTGNWQWASTDSLTTSKFELQSITNSGGAGADSSTISASVFC